MRIAALITATLLLAPVSSFAQGATGSGTTAPTQPEWVEPLLRLSDVAIERIVDARSDLVSEKEKIYAEELSRLEARRIANRSACRGDIRKANRDTKMSVMLRCYRTELTHELATLKIEMQRAQATPGATDTARLHLIIATTSLTDAISTIIEAIDADVYDEAEDLLDAKTRLHAQYRVPLLTERIRFDMDRTRAWSGLMALRALEILRGSPALQQDAGTWKPAVDCLAGIDARAMGGVSQITYLEIQSQLKQLQSELVSCAGSLRSLASWIDPAATGNGEAPNAPAQ